MSASTKRRTEGFADVARWVALDPDGETSVYRKFGELRARSLLYKQCRLADLERRLREADQHDAETDDMEVKDAARTWETLVRQCEAGSEHARARMQLIEDMEVALKSYCSLLRSFCPWFPDRTELTLKSAEALLLESELAKLRKPSNRVLSAYRKWFKEPHPVLGGAAKTFLDDPDDLVAVNGTVESDQMSLFLRRHWPTQASSSPEKGRMTERHH